MAPRRLEAALEAKSKWGGRGKWLAGGTDFVPRMKGDVAVPECLIALHRIGVLREMRQNGQGLSIGSMVTLHKVTQSPLVMERWPLLRQAVVEIGSEAIRSVGTLGGNICNGSPAADSLPALLVMQAELNLRGPERERRVPISDFFLGPSRTALGKEEILTSIILPLLPDGHRSVYLKLGRKRRGDIALVGAAIMLVPQGDGRVEEVRIGLGGVAPTPIRAKGAEGLVPGKTLDDSLIEKIASKAAEESRPISDIRGSADYKREMVSVLVKRGLKRVWDDSEPMEASAATK